MKIQSKTKNQHFVSQTEQRLNACNPNASIESQKIFAFKVNDREYYKVALEKDHPTSIKKNLFWHDLFSFDIETKEIRNSLEELFGEYENKIKTHTRSLLSKLERNSNDIKEELISLFIVKFLNTFRNPYCIKKTLNTIGHVSEYEPLDPELKKVFRKIEKGNRPHENWLCSELEITHTEYTAWLKTLFLLLMRPSENKYNMLEEAVKLLFEKDSHMIHVFVHYYDKEHEDKRVLLSDRGYSLALPQDKFLAFDFNLCSHAFATYIFTDIENNSPIKISQPIVDLHKKMRNNVVVTPLKNNLECLSRFNKNAVYQSYERVYCSANSIYGLLPSH